MDERRNARRILSLALGIGWIAACAADTIAPNSVTRTTGKKAYTIAPCSPDVGGPGCPGGGGASPDSLHSGITFSSGTPMSSGNPLLIPVGIGVSGGYDPVPQLSGSNWPTSLTFMVYVDSASLALPGHTITISLTAVDSGGAGSDGPFGHAHFGGILGLSKPKGSLSTSSVTTDGTGMATVTYTAGRFSGPVKIMATSPGADTARALVVVGVSGLSAFSSAHASLIGTTTSHPSNHWGTDSMNTKLQILWG